MSWWEHFWCIFKCALIMYNNNSSYYCIELSESLIYSCQLVKPQFFFSFLFSNIWPEHNYASQGQCPLRVHKKQNVFREGPQCVSHMPLCLAISAYWKDNHLEKQTVGLLTHTHRPSLNYWARGHSSSVMTGVFHTPKKHPSDIASVRPLNREDLLLYT